MRKVTKTTQIIDLLAKRLRAGEWAPNSFLPPVVSLAEEYSVSPGTIALALKSLERSALVKVLPRQGIISTVGGEVAQPVTPTIGIYGAGAYSKKPRGYYGLLTHSIVQEAQKRGGAVLILPPLPPEQPFSAEYCRSWGVHGILALGGHHTSHLLPLKEEGFPVITGNPPIGQTALNFCGFDHAEYLRDSVVRLAKLGHRRIGFLSYETSTPQLLEANRNPAYEAMLDHGLVYPFNDYWYNLGRTVSEGFEQRICEALESLFSKPEPPTALFCRGIITEPTLKWLATKGLRVPQDVSILSAPFEPGEEHTSGYVNNHDALAAALVQGLYQIIANPFHAVQKYVALTYFEGGTVAPVCS